FLMQCPKFEGSLANGAFTVELKDYIKDSGIDIWIYGHSHYNVDKVIGKTICLTNQLGYVSHNEHSSFDNGKYILLY
ncbi:MAG: serine/threonine protein phosphatase, partial [Bacteroidales bacterium]|nr:serine/threonine protein phosphatase [Bacteroidales bacterium]